MYRQGFSLMELSIVIVIIGLLAGGVVAGRDLVKAGEIRNLLGDLTKYEVALNAFQLKYSALPGDMRDATTYWGAANAVPATCRTTISTGTATCNGDGDGQIENHDGDAPSVEHLRAWQQLANAQLIAGTYTGAGVGGVDWADQTGVNVPAGIRDTGFYHRWIGELSGNPEYYDGSYGQTLAVYTTNGSLFLTTEELLRIDTKIDDGKPGLGKVRAYPSTGSWTPNCTTTAVPATARYKLSYTGIACEFNYSW